MSRLFARTRSWSARVFLVVLASAGTLATPTLATPTLATPTLATPILALGENLEPAIERQLEETLALGYDMDAAVAELRRQCILVHGDGAPVLKALVALHPTSDEDPTSRSRYALYASARLHRIDGTLELASELLDRLCALDPDPRLLLSQGEVLDAAGDIDKAIATYEKVLAAVVAGAAGNAELETVIRLRLALMDHEQRSKGDGGSARSSDIQMIRMVSGSGSMTIQTHSGDDGAGESAPKEGSAEALVRFAAAPGRDPELRNRSAVVLGLIDHPEAAGEIYVLTGEGTVRFRQEVRVADWALTAKDYERASELAWDAVQSAQLGRDRRYALALLVESHRKGESLERLIARFSNQSDLDRDSRNTWIDLLRETGKYEQAMALFRNAGEGEFTVDMRRELLEMCRDAGDEKQLTDTFQDLIRMEPERIEWREGLSRYYLESARGDDARSVWRSFFDEFASQDLDLLLEGMESLRGLGLRQLAIDFAEHLAAQDSGALRALLFLFDLYQADGSVDLAETALERLDQRLKREAGARMELAGAYEKLGRLERTVTILAALREARGPEGFAPDLEMRLAWLYSEVGNEEAALETWFSAWRRVESVSRRRYVEDRILTVASRIGKLADIAIDMEEKFIRGEATERESGLLTRLYTRVGDSVSATEIVEEHLKRSGKAGVKVLNEKARIFVANRDYYKYEQVVRELIKIDPDGTPDYLRQLAMSQLERGKPAEARKVLERLKAIESGPDSAEFEAGVLALAGMREEAKVAYRRGIAAHPNRIEAYLLLAKIMADTDQRDQAIGMFQYLAQAADRDDLFTVAIDGLLNLRAERDILRWARRVTLERIARRKDKLYLYQLVSDLSDAVGDQAMSLRAVEGALPSAGEQRASYLRELMAIAGGGRRGRSSDRLLDYGRRLIRLGDLVPPEVYLGLGEAFLDAGDVTAAAKTFSRATDLPDYGAFQRQVASSFEDAGYLRQALRTYESALLGQADDAGLLAKVAELQESLGRDPLARKMLERGILLLLSRRPFVSKEEIEEDDDPFRFWTPRNISEFDQHFERLLVGFLVTCEDDAELVELLESQRRMIADELQSRARPEARERDRLSRYPRIRDRARFYRRVALAFGKVRLAESLDLELLVALPDDPGLLSELCVFRLSWGLAGSARRLLEAADRSEEQKSRLRFLTGSFKPEELPARIVIPAVTRLILPLVAQAQDDEASVLLQRIDFTSTTEEDLDQFPLLVGAARYLGNSELVLFIAREWVNGILQHHKGYKIDQELRAAFQSFWQVLDNKQRRSLAESLVAAGMEDPKKYMYVFSIVRVMASSFDEPLVDPEELKQKLADDFSTFNSMVMNNLMALVPVANRVEIWREIWPKIALTRRARYLIDILREATELLDSDSTEFILEAFPIALEEMTGELPEYYLFWLADNDHNPKLTTKLLQMVASQDPDNHMNQLFVLLSLSRAGEKERALKLARQLYPELLDDLKNDTKKTNNYYRDRGMEALRGLFLPDRMVEIVALLDAFEEEHGSSVFLSEQRVELIARQRDYPALVAALELASAAHPDESRFKVRLAREHQKRGHLFEAIGIYQGLLEQKPTNKRYRNQLVGLWRRYQNPIKVREVLDAGESKKNSEAEADGEREKENAQRIPQASVSGIQEAVGREDFEDARRIFRRLWRQYQSRELTNDRYFAFYSWGRSFPRWFWPEEAKADPDDAPDRGGLPDLWQETPEDEDRKTVFAALAEETFGVAEMARFARSLSHGQLDVARDLFEAMAVAQVHASGEDEAVRTILERVQAGDAQKIDYSLLLTLLESNPESVGPELRRFLEDLVRSVNPRDTLQLQHVARIYAGSGDSAKAARLYRWCALLVKRDYWGGAQSGSASFASLIEDAQELLTGDDRMRAVETILETARPQEDRFNQAYQQDSYESFVLSTWHDVLGPEKALARCREICEGLEASEGDAYIKRRTAKWAAYLFARAGEIASAMDCFEIALCSFGTEQQSWGLNPDDLRRLFPVDGSGWRDRDGWLMACRAQVRKWRNDDRVQTAPAVQTLSLVAQRLDQSGHSQEARELLTWLQVESAALPHERLWVVDVLREAGLTEDAAAIERTMFDQRLLHVGRLCEVVARERKRSGAPSALALAETAAEYTLPDDLVGLLIELADQCKDSEKQEYWQQIQERIEQIRAADKVKKQER